MARADTSIAEYNRRRDFAKTKEPKGKKGKARRSGLSFLVQKHDATRLHYDLRLEWEGVLKSWAVTRGPSVDPGDKRLAVMTEDHPLSYGDFEGVIPKGQYGGGTVMLWDRGNWEPLHDPEQGLKEGKLHFHLDGERMKGGWALVRMRRRNGEKRDNWLLIKERDDVAGAFDGKDGDILTKKNTTSVKSGRSMKQIAADKDDVWQSGGEDANADKKDTPPAGRARKKSRPRFRNPQLATLVEEAPEGDNWLHEVKFDGYRLMAAIGRGGVALYTRTGLDWTAKFPAVAAALDGLDCDSALIDGEVMAVDVADGKSPFSALQKAIKAGHAMRFYAFDLLALDGEDLAAQPLVERKSALETLMQSKPNGNTLQYSEHVTGRGAEVYRFICGAGQEGIISKRADAPYRGTRGRAWLKVKCTKRQEFVIGGFSRSDKKGRPFASLLVGTHEEDKLVYRGRVGTGFSQDTLDALGAELDKRRRKTMPFEHVSAPYRRGAVWVAPELVAEIDFAEFTDEGHIRHGVYLGLRQDKEAAEVALERTDVPTDRAGAGPSADISVNRSAKGGDAEIAGIRISSPDRVVFPKQGVTKLDLARYHAVAAERMLAHLAERPVSLVRCPQGRQRKCFFQKHAGEGFPAALRRVPIRESSGETVDYMAVSDVQGLISAVQMGTMEFHVWGSRLDRLEQPERLVFDLDPDKGLDFGAVKQAAGAVRDKLDGLGLKSLAMVTGGKGIHVIAPLVRRAEWPEVKAFAKGFASEMAEEEPERFVATMAKARRKGRIFIDWLRNQRGATAIAPYSTRAREGAPVATPVGWDELDGLDAANSYRLADMPARLEEPDPWAAASRWRQSLTKRMLERYL